MNKIVIGDPHGRFRSLDPLLEKAGYDPSEDQLIFVGDYIDGFPRKNFDAKKLIQRIIDLKTENDDVILLLGNHDWWMRDWIRQGDVEPLDIWYTQGGEITLKSYGIDVPRAKMTYNNVKDLIPKSHVQFFEELIPSYYDDKLVTVHGGFTNSRDMLGVLEKAPLEARVRSAQSSPTSSHKPPCFSRNSCSLGIV